MIVSPVILPALILKDLLTDLKIETICIWDKIWMFTDPKILMVFNKKKLKMRTKLAWFQQQFSITSMGIMGIDSTGWRSWWLLPSKRRKIWTESIPLAPQKKLNKKKTMKWCQFLSNRMKLKMVSSASISRVLSSLQLQLTMRVVTFDSCNHSSTHLLYKD